MSKIDVLVFFHILGAFLICGGAGVGIASGMAMARTTSVRALALLSMTAHRAAMVASLPGSLLILVTGTWFIADYPFFELDEFWLWSAYVLQFLAMALDHGLMGPFLKGIHERAARLEAQGVEASEELRVLADAPRGKAVGSALLLLLVVFLYLMVFRPGN